jgi:transcriptional regulator
MMEVIAMYTPQHFNVQNPIELLSFIRTYSFGSLISQTPDGPFATHIPFHAELDGSNQIILYSHMAKANPQWTQADEVLAVFQGPHSYISPTWHGANTHAVPTWNYTAVHAYGKLEAILEPTEIHTILDKMIQDYESSLPTPWSSGQLPENMYQQLSLAIVGIRIRVTKLEGKWKLSQNHPSERRQNIINALNNQPDFQSQAIAHLMQLTLQDK